ncbi:MAG: polyprenyl synthetase family protein, partial [Phycisphaerales bacterium]|nr:polyprenyl synthetase family protein [Phycisphaerales bacterium]
MQTVHPAVGAVADAFSGQTTMSDFDAWRHWFEGRRSAVDNALSTHLNRLKCSTPGNTRLIDAVQYSLTAGGKRLRPVLVLTACEVCGGGDAAAWPAAIAIECVHTFSLIHDDLPAMDDDDLRRGLPTSHKVYGEAHAILAGDWLVTHAFRLLSQVGGSVGSELVATLAEGTEGMIVGQTADIEGETAAVEGGRVKLIHELKTAALIRASCCMGAIAAGASREDRDAMSDYGRRLGLAFQIADDLLDATGTTEDLGKRAGKDAAASKQTYPAAFGVEESRRRAREEVDGACAARSRFGDGAGNLRLLAEYVIRRAT